MSKRLGLRLDPLDTLFFRDGRPFSPATRAEGGLPQPRTLAGALRTRLVRRFVDLGQLPHLRSRGVAIEEALRRLGCPDWVRRLRFRGPWLAQSDNDRLVPLVPTPVILAREGDCLFRLAPLEPRHLPGWRDQDRMPLWRAGGAEAKPAGGFLTLDGLRAFLHGGLPAPAELVKPEELYGFDERTGLAINADSLTGEKGMLYGIRLLALKKDVTLYAEVIAGDDAPADVSTQLEGAMPFGGEGRYVKVTPATLVAWPEAPAAKQSLWLLASPAPFRQAHRPDALPAGVTVHAAATGPAGAFSGWDVARGGPEPTRFAVPAGAVYFVEGEFTPEHASLCLGDNAAVGWGFALRGTWNG